MTDLFNSIKNYNYKEKYENSVDTLMGTAGVEFYKLKNIFDKLFIESDKEGIENIVFDITRKESLKLSSSITDYTLENGEPTQNHITLKPVEITFTGVFGEKVINAPKKTKINKFLQSKLNPLATFSPNLTTQAQQYLNKVEAIANKINDVFDKVQSGLGYLYNLTKTLPTQQARQCLNLMTLWKAREPVVVKTQFITLDNMIIQDVNFESVEETKDKVEVSVTLKQLTLSTIKTVKKTAQLRNNQTNSVNKGKTQGRQTSQAKQLLKNILG